MEDKSFKEKVFELCAVNRNRIHKVSRFGVGAFVKANIVLTDKERIFNSRKEHLIDYIEEIQKQYLNGKETFDTSVVSKLPIEGIAEIEYNDRLNELKITVDYGGYSNYVLTLNKENILCINPESVLVDIFKTSFFKQYDELIDSGYGITIHEIARKMLFTPLSINIINNEVLEETVELLYSKLESNIKDLTFLQKTMLAKLLDINFEDFNSYTMDVSIDEVVELLHFYAKVESLKNKLTQHQQNLAETLEYLEITADAVRKLITKKANIKDRVIFHNKNYK